MPGFTVSDGSALGSADLHGRERNAAIAAMGQRLAAARLRRRQRSVALDDFDRAHGTDVSAVAPVSYEDRTPFAPDVWVDLDLAEWAARVPPAADVDQAAPHWRDYLGTARQVAMLGATGACGFALVIFALRFGAIPERTGPAPRAANVVQAQPQTKTADAGSNAMPAALAPAAPVVVPRQVARAASAQLRLPTFVPALATAPVRAPAPTGAQAARIAALHVQALRRAVETARRSETTTARARLRRAAPVTVAHAAARPHAAAVRVAAGRDDWPRWLTEDQASRPRVIMSEPPHNLVQPANMGGAGAVADAAPAPVRRAPVVVASSGDGAAGADRGPVYRPYYGSVGGGYSPYPYGAYAGGGYAAGAP